MDSQNTNIADSNQPDQKSIKPRRSRKRSIIIFTVVSLLNAGLLILLWTQLLTPSSNASNGNNTAVDPLKGHRAPNFTLAAINAKAAPLNLANFKGKAIVLNFWGATCVPCQQEAPMLQKQWQQAQAQGIVFIGVDFQDVQSDGLSFMQKYGITYPNALDPNGTTAVNYGVTFTPTTFFINSQGVVVSSIPREMTANELQSGIKSLLHT